MQFPYEFEYLELLTIFDWKWKKCLDGKGLCGVLLTDLSKAFDCLYHDLLIAKSSAFGFSHKSLKLVYNYMTKRVQRL